MRITFTLDSGEVVATGRLESSRGGWLVEVPHEEVQTLEEMAKGAHRYAVAKGDATHWSTD